MRSVRLACTLLAASLCACASPKPEAAAVINAVDRFRRAENPQKPAAADALDAVACSDPEVCAAKDACAKSARATAKGLKLKNEVERGLADVESGKLAKDDPAAQALQGKLLESMSANDEGHRLLPACDDKILTLKRKYGL